MTGNPAIALGGKKFHKLQSYSCTLITRESTGIRFGAQVQACSKTALALFANQNLFETLDKRDSLNGCLLNVREEQRQRGVE